MLTSLLYESKVRDIHLQENFETATHTHGQDCTNGRGARMDERIAFVVSMLEADIQRPLNVQGLAAKVNLSSSRLRHLFRIEKGTTLAKYQRELRLQAARMLLVTSFLTIKEVMNQVGISDSSNFSHVFKTAFGVSPETYRINASTSTIIGEVTH